MHIGNSHINLKNIKEKDPNTKTSESYINPSQNSSIIKNIPKNPSTTNLLQYRKTDYTDQINSEIGSSQIRPNLQRQRQRSRHTQRQRESKYDQRQRKVSEGGALYYGGVSRAPKPIDQGLFRAITQRESRVVELRERLRNIHHFYRIRIEQERNKNIQRSQIFLGIIQQLQQIHTQKLLTAAQPLQSPQQPQNTSTQLQIAQVDQKISQIQTQMQKVLQQTQYLKTKKQALSQQLIAKRLIQREKEDRIEGMRSELMEVRGKLEGLERMGLKENKRIRDIGGMVDFGMGVGLTLKMGVGARDYGKF